MPENCSVLNLRGSSTIFFNFSQKHNRRRCPKANSVRACGFASVCECARGGEGGREWERVGGREVDRVAKSNCTTTLRSLPWCGSDGCGWFRVATEQSWKFELGGLSVHLNFCFPQIPQTYYRALKCSQYSSELSNSCFSHYQTQRPAT